MGTMGDGYYRRRYSRVQGAVVVDDRQVDSLGGESVDDDCCSVDVVVVAYYIDAEARPRHTTHPAGISIQFATRTFSSSSFPDVNLARLYEGYEVEYDAI